MHRALDSVIGLPRSSTNASRMLAFLTPADVSRSFTMPPGSPLVKSGPRAWTPGHRETHRSSRLALVRVSGPLHDLGLALDRLHGGRVHQRLGTGLVEVGLGRVGVVALVRRRDPGRRAHGLLG